MNSVPAHMVKASFDILVSGSRTPPESITTVGPHRIAPNQIGGLISACANRQLSEPAFGCCNYGVPHAAPPPPAAWAGAVADSGLAQPGKPVLDLQKFAEIPAASCALNVWRLLTRNVGLD